MGERVEVVEPVAPERLDMVVGDKNAAETREPGDEEWVDECGGHRIGCISGHELPHACAYEFVNEDNEEDCTCFVDVRRKAHGIVKSEEVDNSAYDQIWDL